MILLFGHIKPPSNGAEKDLEKKLLLMLDRINREGKGIHSPYTLTGRGEFHAVYSGSENIFDHVWLILYQMHPDVVRISLIASKDVMGDDTENSLTIDNPLFKQARERLDENEYESGIIVITKGGGPVLALMNHSLTLVSRVMKNWKKKRFAILYGLSRGRTIKEIARLLDITERSVYKNINAGSLDTILSTVDQISGLLGKDFKQ